MSTQRNFSFFNATPTNPSASSRRDKHPSSATRSHHPPSHTSQHQNPFLVHPQSSASSSHHARPASFATSSHTHTLSPFLNVPSFPSNPSASTQGLFSTYASRIKEGSTALILPNSFLTGKRTRAGGDDSDDFDEFLEESDRGTPFSGAGVHDTRSRGSGGLAAALAAAGGREVGDLAPAAELKKVMRRTNHVYASELELERVAGTEEVLVPIRLDIDLDDVKLRDSFVWNMNEQIITPENFAEILCEDLELPLAKFVPVIAGSIRAQVQDFEAIHEIEVPGEDMRVVINLDLQVGKQNLRDRFEWDLSDSGGGTMAGGNAPEEFAYRLAADMGIGGEFVSIIAHSIREQLYRHKKERIDEYGFDEGTCDPLMTAFRSLDEAHEWAPHMETLSADGLEKLLLDKERSIRRLRRETSRYTRTRRLSPTPGRVRNAEVAALMGVPGSPGKRQKSGRYH
ncbi:hypothetical protein BC938DRAFT_480872 [Jimgerdemannia flammicorona]|uniref:SNF5-domain-containing protein n=1 Tax=Jimgerdemannia flammicorona TaxID=994334 RepID=A0A433QHH3_9FUNG|nr:hypothetical protein BC938DRAFT_480872 [Jimgerdemannia flammicorona]